VDAFSPILFFGAIAVRVTFGVTPTAFFMPALYKAVIQDREVKMTKSLIKYAGGKTFALDHILPYFENYDEVFSPFFGGGSVELNLAAMGKRVYGCDIFRQLVTFWNMAINQPVLMYMLIKTEWDYFHNESISDNEKRDRFYMLKEICKMTGINELMLAMDFFVVNRLSFSGLTLMGGFSKASIKSCFSVNILERLRNFKVNNLTVECMNFYDSFERYGDRAIYADPPYMINSYLYGEDGSSHRNFDHVGLRDLLIQRDHWVLSYNNCQKIRNLYRGYRMIEPKWRYCMNASGKSNELLIFGHGIEI
jgi:DNA adenine methylase